MKVFMAVTTSAAPFEICTVATIELVWWRWTSKPTQRTVFLFTSGPHFEREVNHCVGRNLISDCKYPHNPKYTWHLSSERVFFNHPDMWGRELQNVHPCLLHFSLVKEYCWIAGDGFWNIMVFTFNGIKNGETPCKLSIAVLRNLLFWADCPNHPGQLDLVVLMRNDSFPIWWRD